MGKDADLEEVMKGEYIGTETGLKLDTYTYHSSSATRAISPGHSPLCPIPSSMDMNGLKFCDCHYVRRTRQEAWTMRLMVVHCLPICEVSNFFKFHHLAFVDLLMVYTQIKRLHHKH